MKSFYWKRPKSRAKGTSGILCDHSGLLDSPRVQKRGGWRELSRGRMKQLPVFPLTSLLILLPPKPASLGLTVTLLYPPWIINSLSEQPSVCTRPMGFCSPIGSWLNSHLWDFPALYISYVRTSFDLDLKFRSQNQPWVLVALSCKITS